MTRIIRGSLLIPGVLLFILVLAMMPLVLQAGGPQGSLQFHWSQGFESIKNYLTGIGNGESFRFFSGKTEHYFWEQIGGYFKLSFMYIAGGAIIGTTVGILIGILFAYARGEWWKRLFEMSGILPDFVIIILLQYFVIRIAKESGIVLFKIANYSSNDPAIVLPLLSMIIIPANYILRNVALQMRLTLSEDYIRSAKALGLRKLHITFFHALPNVFPFIKADLHKFMGIVIGNLFIVEYFYNIRGVTRLLFADAFAYQGYQYALVVNGLLALMVLYAALYGLLRLFLFGWEKVFVR